MDDTRTTRLPGTASRANGASRADAASRDGATSHTGAASRADAAPPTDAARFEAIFRAHHAAVLGYALRRADADTAHDAVADAFLVCWRRLDDVPADPRPWLFGVARRCLANRRRGAARHTALAARVAEPGHAEPAFGERLDIHAAFRRLSERDREALALVAWEGLDHAAAARALGCTRAAFAVRFHRARRRLAHHMNTETP